MTGRDLIIYILNNNLEDTSILSVDEMALKLSAGPSTVKALIELDKIKGLRFGNDYLVFNEERNE